MYPEPSPPEVTLMDLVLWSCLLWAVIFAVAGLPGLGLLATVAVLVCLATRS